MYSQNCYMHALYTCICVWYMYIIYLHKHMYMYVLVHVHMHTCMCKLCMCINFTIIIHYSWHPWDYKVSSIKRCPYFRGWFIHICSNWDLSQCPLYRGCPYFRGIHGKRFHCIVLNLKNVHVCTCTCICICYCRLEVIRAEREDQLFPDEVDTPQDVPARVRFAKYRPAHCCCLSHVVPILDIEDLRVSVIPLGIQERTSH